jgi:hypothetical protein
MVERKVKDIEALSLNGILSHVQHGSPMSETGNGS